jgi:hypothetical protein
VSRHGAISAVLDGDTITGLVAGVAPEALICAAAQFAGVGSKARPRIRRRRLDSIVERRPGGGTRSSSRGCRTMSRAVRRREY